MPLIPIILAQAAAEVPDPTLGQILGGLCVMGAMAGSFIMICVWIARLRNGAEVMPFAYRKPLIVPWPLIVFGLILATFMAYAVFAGGTMDPELLGQPAAQDNAVADEDAVADEGGATAAENDSVASDVAATEATEADSGEQAGQDLEADADNVNQPGKLSPAALKQRFLLVMMSNIMTNIVIFSIFAVVIWVFQQRHSRRLVTNEDVGYEIGVAYVPTPAVERFPDLDSPPAHLAIPDSTNPFAAPPQQPLAAKTGEDEGQLQPLEAWSFSRELIFAVETFFVAYLPTTLIRVLFVAAAPETKSHPLLQMLEQGVDVEIMGLIFLMAVVVAPVVEELMFRVAIFGGMFQRNSFALGLIISSVLFGLAHGYPDCFALMPLAAAIGFTYSRRRSYRTAILVHFLFNAFNMFLAGISMV